MKLPKSVSRLVARVGLAVGLSLSASVLLTPSIAGSLQSARPLAAPAPAAQAAQPAPATQAQAGQAARVASASPSRLAAASKVSPLTRTFDETGSTDPAEIVRRAWQQARKAGRYRFVSDMTQSLCLAPDTDHRLYASHTAAGASTYQRYRNGYYGSHLYDIPLRDYLRVLDSQGDPALGVQVALYQRANRWDWMCNRATTGWWSWASNGQTFDYLTSYEAGFRAPVGVAADVAAEGRGNLAVADTNNNRVVVLDAHGKFLAEFTAPKDG